MPLNKAACFTDIHWGRKNNSELHNQDCLRFISWFCDQVRHDIDIDHIIFLGDWFEQRAAINGLTLDYAYRGACKLKALGLPVYFIVGNHDLYYRTTRDIFSTNLFNSLGFHMINEPNVYPELGKDGTLLCPFLFESEYAGLAQYLKTPVWIGHFEFKGFVITGDTRIMNHGPDPADFSKPTRILSGHFHKRQTLKNITYIGNAFPADFSDANDIERGMATYTYEKNKIEFFNWKECPSYIRTTLSDLTKDADNILRKDAIVNCMVDMDITYEQSLKLKTQLATKYKLREINLQENPEKMLALEGTKINDEDLDQLGTTDALVKAMLSKLEVKAIDNKKLIKIYEEL